MIVIIDDKMKNQKYHVVGTVPKSTTKILEKCKIDTLNTNHADYNSYLPQPSRMYHLTQLRSEKTDIIIKM